VIFVDSNIPMYLIGAPHPHKLDAQRVVQAAIAAGEPLFTDAEVLQEICHRFVALRRRDMIQPGFDAIIGIVDEVLPIEREDAEAAKDIVLRYPTLSARDAVHVAVMNRHGLTRIMTFDRGYDGLFDVERVG
jgi:predicted nucleic acid-binding protein